MSLRLRLAALYTAVLAVAVVVFSLALLLIHSHVALGALEDGLIAEASKIASSPRFKLDDVPHRYREIGGPELLAQTVGLDGSVVARSPNLEDSTLPLSDDALRTLRGGGAVTEAGDMEAGRVLVHSVAAREGRQVVGFVQVGRSLAEHEQSVATLQRVLIAGSAVAVVLAFALGWFFAGTALRPIGRIARAAHAIGARRDFTQRVHYAGPNDELSHLVVTLNGMLGELQSAYDQIGHTLQTQRRFVADASHELRTPLTTIRGNLGLLAREPPIAPTDRVAVTQDSIAECERLIGLVNRLLVLTRADAEQPLRSLRFELAPLVQEVGRAARALGRNHVIECSTDVQTEVVGDREAVRQVLMAIVDNAIKHTPASAHVAINASADAHRATVTVTDTGPGIDPADLPRIFDRFYRADSARSGEGFGLGLSIARQLAERMGGEIAVESERGQGSTFTLSLPLATADEGSACARREPDAH